jgi:capsular exopolysaccharide synthesis family protein
MAPRTRHEDSPEPELRDYLHILRRRKWIIVISVLVGVLLALFLSYLQTPIYQASARLLVQPDTGNDPFNPTSAQAINPNQVQTEVQVVESRPVEDEVRRQLGAVPGVAVSPIGQTNVISVRARSTSPAHAAAVANAYANAYIGFKTSQAVKTLLDAAAQIQLQINDLQQQIAKAPPDQVAALQTTLEAFKQRQSETTVDARLVSGGAQLVSPAVVPSTPVVPRTRRNVVIGVVVGALFGIGLAFLFEYLDDSIKSKDDLERASHGSLPTLGLIPAVSGWKNRAEARVASLADPNSPAAESYRALRTSVQFLGLDHPVQVLQMTSPSADEGKTTTLANLGVALARAGQKVVISCADLRRPRIHDFFGLDNSVGLTSVILGDAVLSAAVQSVPDVENLYVLASGPLPPNPSELLNSDHAAQVLTELRAEFDMVLLDSPPVLPVTDAAILSTRVDATLLVATAGKTTRRAVSRAVELLRQVEAPLVGSVLNRVKDQPGYGYGYGYGYYRYYGPSSRSTSSNGSSRKPVPK